MPFELRSAFRESRLILSGFVAYMAAANRRRGAWFARAGVVELVDTPDLGSGGFGHGGSSPSARTNLVYELGLPPPHSAGFGAI